VNCSHLPEFSVKDLQAAKSHRRTFAARWSSSIFGLRGVSRAERDAGYQKLLNLYGSRGFAVIGFKFDTMMDMEDPVQFARKIGVRYPLAVAPET